MRVCGVSAKTSGIADAVDLWANRATAVERACKSTALTGLLSRHIGRKLNPAVSACVADHLAQRIAELLPWI